MKFASYGVRWFSQRKKNEVDVRVNCQKKMASGVKFPNQNMKSVQCPWVHGSEVKRKRSARPVVEVKYSSSATTNLKFISEVPPSQRSNQTKPQQNQTKRSVVSMAIYPKYFKQLRGVLWKIRAYIRKCVRMKCETIFLYTRAVRSQTTLPKG